MKKLLLLLFLLFNLTLSTPIQDIKDVDYTELSELKRHEQVVIEVSKLIEEKDNVVYHNWDNIPILSPIKIQQLKRISDDYGMRKHPIYKKWMWHRGIDFVAIYNTPIHATADGIVTKVTKSKYGYGNRIEIQHDNEFKTRYTHLNKINVKKGDHIIHDQIIGTLGNTGLSTGPHLHYEILRNNLQIDPMYFSYIDKQERSKIKYYLLLNDLNEI